MSNLTFLAPAPGSIAICVGQHPRHRELLRVGRISIHFFVVAVAFFALGVVAMPFVIADVVAFFYQMMPLALVHTFTLGWITAAMMGVMYRYV
ncbi:MAG TPA: hypothetical protein VLI44_08690, partial [Sporolactobacillaceae bacterium]|nr:hypothetical protein [Sporolactobacillaceae bacterium]